MSRNKPATVTGVIVINKHSGVTSHKIVSALRKLYDMPKVGHTGTLDPMATGVLPVLLGRAVKAADFLLAEDKEYIAEMKLGITTDTQDITGEILSRSAFLPSAEDVEKTVSAMTGEIMQIPPMYSAIKIDGRKLYDVAREGKEIERKARKINIYSLESERLAADTYRLHVRCSKGTYIRTLCNDIGAALGCGAAMSALCRTRSGPFTLENAVTVDELSEMSFEERLSLPAPTETLFENLPSVEINGFYAKLIKGGTELYQKKIHTNFPLNTTLRLRFDGEMIALGKVMQYETGLAIKPIKLFVL